MATSSNSARSARRPTLRDVAERAGVSFKTVSRVINDEGTVSPDLTRRVNAAIDELGYRPDQRARHLRSSDTATGAIGFVLVDVANPFFSSILRGIEEEAREHDYLVFTGSTDGSPERERELIGAFLARRVDGLIIVSSGDNIDQLVREQQRGTPVVFLDLEPAKTTFDVVRSDHFGGAVAATNHLLDQGHRDIAFFGDDEGIYSARQRLHGFLAAMGEAGIDVPDHRYLMKRYTSAEWTGFFIDYLGQPPMPTAIFTAQNFITIGAASALNELGLRTTIAQIGFDDIELADLLDPAITVVPQEPRDLGQRAAAELFRRIDGDDGPPRVEILDCVLIPRGSGEIPPATV